MIVASGTIAASTTQAIECGKKAIFEETERTKRMA